MAFAKFELERKAHQALSDLYEQAVLCREFHERAGLKIPVGLERLFGDWTEEVSDDFDVLAITPLPSPPSPDLIPDSWVFIPVEDAGPTSLVLAILAIRTEPASTTEITAAATRYLKSGGLGNVSNSLSRLAQRGLVTRINERYSIVDAEKAPIIQGDYVWAHPETFSSQELAAYRRIAVIHVLKHSAEGLQSPQILDALVNAAWFKARPVTKDNIRGDLHSMEQGKAVVRFSDGKWALPQSAEETENAM